MPVLEVLGQPPPFVPHLGGHPHSAARGWLSVLPRVLATLVRPSWCPRGTGGGRQGADVLPRAPQS